MKQLLLDAIIGKGVNSTKVVTRYKNYIEFTGNQWNEDWAWRRNKLKKLSEKELKKIYDDIC